MQQCDDCHYMTSVHDYIYSVASTLHSLSMLFTIMSMSYYAATSLMYYALCTTVISELH